MKTFMWAIFPEPGGNEESFKLILDTSSRPNFPTLSENSQRSGASEAGISEEAGKGGGS
jgi:hypothetical protein